VKIGIVLDSPKRDLRGIALVAHELLKRGAEVYIMPMYQHGHDVPLLAPDAVLVNYARPNNAPLLQMFHALGIRTIVCDTEGGVLSEAGADAPPNWARQFKALGLSRCIDRYFFWGARLREAFAAAGALAADALEVTGCPRYDLCHPRWHALLDYPERDFVLVNTNFSALNPRFGASADGEVRVFERMGWGRNYAHSLFKELQAVFPRYIEAIGQMAQRNPQRRFVVRHHPFEDGGLYEREFASLANVKVDGSGDVLNPISRADCIVHLNCGTAVESVLLGKTPISLEFLNTPALRAHAPVPAAISCPAANPDDLDLLINSPAARCARWRRDELLPAHIEPWFYRLDGRASERIACSMIDVARHGDAHARRSVAHSITGGARWRGASRWLQGLVCNVAGSRAAERLRSMANPARSEKSVAANEVKDLLTHYAQCEAVSVQPRVKHARHPWTGLPLASLHMCADMEK
jgi:surface carbohydrate biosynthesis protein